MERRGIAVALHGASFAHLARAIEQRWRRRRIVQASERTSPSRTGVEVLKSQFHEGGCFPLDLRRNASGFQRRDGPRVSTAPAR